MFLGGCHPRDALVIADGRVLTATARDQEIELRLALFKLANPTATYADEARFKQTLLATAEEHFIEETGLLRVADEKGCAATAAEAIARLRRISPKIDSLPQDLRLAAERIAMREILCEKAVHALATNISIQVSAEEVTNMAHQVAEYAHIAEATNALIHARATNIWQQLRKGADFHALANKHTEDQNECKDGEWGSFPLSAFSDSPLLRSLVEQLKIGEITPPVEGDGGLLIVRLKHLDAETSPACYDLERIFFRLPEPPPPHDLESIEKSLAEEKKKNALSSELRRIRRQTHVTRLPPANQQSAVSPINFRFVA
jgi:hypothetical protein